VATQEYSASRFVLVRREAQLLLVVAFMEIYSGCTERAGCIIKLRINLMVNSK